MNFVSSVQNRYHKLAYIGFALLMSVLFDVFFWNKELGLGFLVFVLIYLAGFIGLAMITNQPYNKKALFLLAPILVLSFDVVIYNNDLVTSLVVLAVIGLLVLFTFLFTLRNTLANPFDFRNIPLLRKIGLPFSKWVQILRDLLFFNQNGKNDCYKKIAFGVLVSVPLLLIFGALFSQADAVFAQWFRDVFSFHYAFPEEFGPRVVRTVIFTLYLASLLYVVFDNDYTLSANTYSVKKFDPTIVATVLTLVNVLFLLFVFIQVRYLFGSSNFVLENGLTFADYARAGFFQLTAVLVLSGGLLALLYRSYSAHGHDKLSTVLKILLIVQVEIIAISALRRMNLYQAEYGFTTLRLYVEWFIYFIMILFVALAFCIARQVAFRKLFFGALVYGVVAFTVVASINVDRMIAEQNIARFYQGKKIDVPYLSTLRADAIPLLVDLSNANPILQDPQYGISHFGGDNKTSLSVALRDKKEFLERHDTWTEFNFAVSQALQKLNNLIVR
ncbi:MAG: DUF4173 domain-containing protein [Candidatus Magasanikbacteria bacterium]|nr:DUF4173 domain-containing protein [Candidatus Magasanikbacteria bacterium]